MLGLYPQFFQFISRHFFFVQTLLASPTLQSNASSIPRFSCCCPVIWRLVSCRGWRCKYMMHFYKNTQRRMRSAGCATWYLLCMAALESENLLLLLLLWTQVNTEQAPRLITQTRPRLTPMVKYVVASSSFGPSLLKPLSLVDALEDFSFDLRPFPFLLGPLVLPYWTFE